MADTTPMYGYASDEVKMNPFKFGLNPNARLTKFEWIPNGGEKGKEMEALDIKFTINGTEKSYRMFPVNKAFTKDNKEVTDPNSQEMKDAFMDLSARVVHILNAFYEDKKDFVKTALQRPFKTFKEYCQVAAALLPKDYGTKELDIFLQYQWTIDEEQKKAYLEIPRKMKYGRWLTAHREGNWKEQRAASPDDSTTKALWYIKVDDEGEPILDNGQQIEHPFIKNGWFVNSNFATQQRLTSGAVPQSAASAAMNANATERVADSTPPPPITTW